MTLSERRVAVLAAHYVPAYRAGGPIRTLEALVHHTPDTFATLLFTSDRDLQQSERLPVESNTWVRHERAEVFYASTESLHSYLSGILELRKKNPDILYLNSFFSLRFSSLPLALAKFKFFGQIRVLLAPRGEFSTGALNLKSLKKRYFIRLTHFLRLYEGITWHASSDLEAQDIRLVHPNTGRIIVKGNETLLKPVNSPKRHAGDEGPRPLHAVFASRIVPMKGLDILLSSLTTVKEDISLDIIGTKEDAEYFFRCMKIIEALPNNISVNFKGALQHSELMEVLPAYDVMLFPTRGENFGHIIAESLSVGLPVFCSPHTSWNDILNDEGGGSVVAHNTPEAWSSAIARLGSLSSAELWIMKETALSAFRRWAADRNATSVFELLDSVDAAQGRHSIRPRIFSRTAQFGRIAAGRRRSLVGGP